MMEFSPKNKTPLVAARGVVSQLERQLAKAPAFTKEHNHNVAVRQGFCADCYYFRSIPIRYERRRTFCAFTGEKIGLYSTGCGFYAEVSVYA